MNELLSDGGDCGTAPATPGLLNMISIKQQQNYKRLHFQWEEIQAMIYFF